MNVFISYRRNDTQDLAGRLADRLRAVPEIRQVFLDVEEIAPGTDFGARIQDALARDPVCLLLIGSNWCGERTGAAPRILDDGDFVRMEAAAALASGLRVLPVLANGATMPTAEQLPADLHRMPAINAVSLRHATFDHDIHYLIAAILDKRKPGTLAAYLRDHPVQASALRGLIGFAAATAILLLLAVLHRAVFSRSLDSSLGGRGPVWMLIVAVLLAGTIAGILLRPRWRRKSGPAP